MTIARFMALLACGAALALGACSDTKRVPVGDPAGLEAEKDRADAERDRADAEKERADTYDPRLSLNDALLPSRLSRIGLPLHLTPKGSVEADAEGPVVTWTARTRTDIEVAAGVTTVTVVALDNDIQKVAVPWAAGKTLGLGPAGAVSTDEFALRGIVVRGGPLGRQTTAGARVGADGTYNPPVQGLADTGAWRNWNAAYESSIRMKADGLTLKMGGDGTIFFDFERLGALGSGGAAYEAENQPEGATCAVTGSAGKCDDAIASDVTATFGTPVADPDGEAAWHFKMRVPVNPAAPHVDTRDFDALPGWAKFTDDAGNTLFRVPDPDGPYEDGDGRYRVERTPIVTDLATTLAADAERADWKPLETKRAQRIDRGRPDDELGVYNVWLSNYAGVDDKGTAADESDDTRRYLKYAAYGLFNFLDYSTRGMNYARAQAFHFGYDAFGNTDGNRPADWGTAANPIVATFNGRTTGWMIRGTLEEAGRLTELIRMRGDVTLTATFNARNAADDASGHGAVQGSMNNFEFLRNDIWSTDVNYRILRNDPARTDAAAVLLQAADIGADGSFRGVARATYNGVGGTGIDNFTNDGAWGGAFYGPKTLGELEAAGYWNLRMNTAGDPGRGALIGSFGVVSDPPPAP